MVAARKPCFLNDQMNRGKKPCLAHHLHRVVTLGRVGAHADFGARVEAGSHGGGHHHPVGPDELVRLLLLEVHRTDGEHITSHKDSLATLLAQREKNNIIL